MTLALLNLDHDLALASDSDNYLPTARVAKMMADLSMLPLWYCRDTEIVIDGETDEATAAIAEKLGIECRISTYSRNPAMLSETKAMPWGWNKSIARRLARAGINNLPAADRLNGIRRLSSRETSIEMLDKLRHINGTTGQRWIAGDCAVLASRQDFIVKSLWSSSGKGLVWNVGHTSKQTIDRVNAELRKHSAFVIEPIYEGKIADIAMEFIIDDNGKCRFIGYSVFETDDKGQYVCNLLGDMAATLIGRYLPCNLTDDVKASIIDFAEERFAGVYAGPFGVDMMICRQGDKVLLHPCIEINLRMNMGIVALCLTGLMARETSGRFTIVHHANGQATRDFDEMMKNKYPPAISGGRIARGYIALTPVRDDTCHLACMVVGE